MKTKVCTECGYVGKPITQCAGSFLVDVFAWMVAASVTAFTGLLPILLIPAAWTVYHIVMFRSVKCPKCENLSMVRTEGRKGKEAMQQHAH